MTAHALAGVNGPVKGPILLNIPLTPPVLLLAAGAFAGTVPSHCSGAIIHHPCCRSVGSGLRSPSIRMGMTPALMEQYQAAVVRVHAAEEEMAMMKASMLWASQSALGMPDVHSSARLCAVEWSKAGIHACM